MNVPGKDFLEKIPPWTPPQKLPTTRYGSVLLQTMGTQRSDGIPAKAALCSFLAHRSPQDLNVMRDETLTPFGQPCFIALDNGPLGTSYLVSEIYRGN